jgi:hypothetical protein
VNISNVAQLQELNLSSEQATVEDENSAKKLRQNDVIIYFEVNNFFSLKLKIIHLQEMQQNNNNDYSNGNNSSNGGHNNGNNGSNINKSPLQILNDLIIYNKVKVLALCNYL